MTLIGMKLGGSSHLLCALGVLPGAKASPALEVRRTSITICDIMELGSEEGTEEKKVDR